MQVDHVELTDYSDPSPFENWIANHPNATVIRVLSSGSHFYIWYTE